MQRQIVSVGKKSVEDFCKLVAEKCHWPSLANFISSARRAYIFFPCSKSIEAKSSMNLDVVS